MFNDQKILAVIPARGGSKGLQQKNIVDFYGKPLIQWTIEAGKKSNYIDRLILSSDDINIINVAKECGCEIPFIRPQEFAQDDTPGIAPILHAVDMLPDYDYIIVLQPTSPLRRIKDIDQALELCIVKSAETCVSVTEASKSPFWMYQLDAENTLSPLFPGENFSRRQQLPKSFFLNGAIYISRVAALKSTKSFINETTLAYVMEPQYSIDIDNSLDLAWGEFLLTQGLT